MPRLGELLVAAGLLTVEQVEKALRAQVLWGGRLGTNIVELHYLELDPLSKVLGRQHRLPAALARHFQKADPALQRMLSPEVAERFFCVPLLRMGPEQHVVIASLTPLSAKQLAIIAGELAVDVQRLVPAIAAELRIRYQLERVYHLGRTARFLRTRGKSIPPFPDFQILPVPPDPDLDLPSPTLPMSTQEMAVFRPPLEPPPLGDLSRHATLDDELAIPAEPIEDEITGRQRRKYVRTIADVPSSDSERQALIGRIAIRKVAVGSALRIMAGATLGEATRAIRLSTGRDRVADLVIDTLERFAPACEAAILLVVRGAIAIGWKGFQRNGGALGEIAVPMEDGGLVPRAIESNGVLRKPCGELDTIDRLLLASLGQHAGDLVVVPISIADKAMCVIAIATAENAPVESAEPIAAAAGAAFARLMRDASR
jgi:hypothetical protein